MDPIKCAEEGDVEFFKAAGLYVIQESRDDGGSSVLALAARMGHLNCCRVIYQRCPQLLYEVDIFGDTPLHEAAEAGKPEIIRCLLYARALLEALEAGAEDLIKMGKRYLSADYKLLIMQDYWEQGTALHYATIQGCRESVQLLVDADPSRKLLMVVDACKRTALHAAAQRGHSDIVKDLLIFTERKTLSISGSAANLMHKWEKHNKSTSNASDVSMAFELYEEIYHSAEEEYEPLEETAQDEYEKHVKDMLLMVDNESCTALHHAVEKGFDDIAEFLVSQAESVRHTLLTVQNHKGKTAIQIAVEKNLLEFMDYLLGNERILTIEQAMSCDRIPVSDSVAVEYWMQSSSTDHLKDMLLMVENEACTALHHAVENGFDDIAKCLVNRAYSVRHTLFTVQNHKGKTAIQIAVEKNLLSFMDYLLRTERTLTLEQALSCDRISDDIRRLLGEYSSELPQALLNCVSHKENINALADTIQNWPECLEFVDSLGQNILHLATNNGQERVVKLILGMPERDGKILNMQDFQGNTPLHIAALGGNPSIIYPLLYDKRVNKLILNKQGKSALDAINFEYDKRRAGVFGLTERVDEKDLKDRSDFDLLVGALISTLSFTAGIAVPGGYFSEGPNQGNAVLHKKISFHVFVISNTIALVLSLSAVFSHFCTRRLINEKSISSQLEVATYCSLGAIFAMMVAFMAGSYTVLAVSHWLDIVVCVICCGFFGIAIPSLWRMVREQGQRWPSHHNSV